MNKCTIGNKQFKFNEQNVLIDLSSNNHEKVFLLVLVADKNYAECKRVKLIKYKVGKEYILFSFLFIEILNLKMMMLKILKILIKLKDFIFLFQLKLIN